MQEETNLTPEEKEAFESLDKFKLPDASLENRIIEQLKFDDLIMEQKPKRSYTFAIAASVVIVAVAGYLIAAGLDMSANFYIFAIPMAVGGLIAYTLHIK